MDSQAELFHHEDDASAEASAGLLGDLSHWLEKVDEMHVMSAQLSQHSLIFSGHGYRFPQCEEKGKKINNHTKLATLKTTKSSFPENIPEKVLNIENVQSGTFKVLSLYYNICCCMEIWFTYSF